MAMELQLLQTPAWKSQKHTVLPHSQIVRVNNRVNRQIFANLSSSKGGSLTAASTSTTTPSRVLHIPSFFYEYVVLLQVMASFLQFHQAMICEQKIEVILANCLLCSRTLCVLCTHLFPLFFLQGITIYFYL